MIYKIRAAGVWICLFRQRVRDIHISDYYRWLYVDRKGIEIYDSDFIGRIKPRYLPADNILEIKGMWIENKCCWNKNISAAFYKYLEAFKNYLTVNSIKWVCSPPKY